jgi:hypothetical protein
MSLKNLLKRLILEEVNDCVSCQGQKPTLLKEEKVYNDISPIFRGTKLNNKKFLSESAKLLAKGDNCTFLGRLYEQAEEMDALLDICLLTFSTENTKLGDRIMTFSLPAGWTCPFAKDCLKKVNRERVIDPEKAGTTKISKRTGKEVEYTGDVVVTKGKDAQFDCYAANQEMQYDAVRANRWHNFDLLKAAGKDGGAAAQADLIERSIDFFVSSNGEYEKLRIHESGDFYNNEYFEAWMMVAQRMPEMSFYAYTKSVPYVKYAEEKLKNIPNFAITLSKGGRADDELENVDIKQSEVFQTPEQVLKAGLLIDLDDTLAMQPGGRDKTFALLIHGTQEAGAKSKDKARNETFMAYWKYWMKINKQLIALNIIDSNDKYKRLSSEEALIALKKINDVIDNKEYTKNKNINKTGLDFLAKLLRYIIKYNNYNFDDRLIATIPPKFRPPNMAR